MSATVPPTLIAFLKDLTENNSKDWFQANKKRYETELKAPARAVVEDVNAGLAKLSPAHAREQSHKALNRINRDIRFSKDKTPYNTRVWAGFHNGTVPKGTGAGYYFGFSPTGLGIGCGAWAPPKEALASLRSHIAANHQQLKAALDALPAGYGELDGEKLKRVPKPFDPDHPAGEWLKHKGYHLRIEFDPEEALRDDLVDLVLTHFGHLQPIVNFLDEGMAG